MLGRFWSYITPEYLYFEVDVPDLRNFLALVPKEYSDWIYRRRRKNNYTGMAKAGVKVIKPNG